METNLGLEREHSLPGDRDNEIAELRNRARRLIETRGCLCSCGYPVLQEWADGKIDDPDQVRAALDFHEDAFERLRENLARQGVNVDIHTLLRCLEGSE